VKSQPNLADSSFTVFTYAVTARVKNIQCMNDFVA